MFNPVMLNPCGARMPFNNARCVSRWARRRILRHAATTQATQLLDASRTHQSQNRI